MADLERYIDQGTGREPADIVLKGGQFFDLVTGELVASDIAISGERIVGTCGPYKGRTEIDITGRIVVPGFIDTHMHIESSLVTPHEFDRCVLPYGVTTVICDPHEIANALGAPGVRYFLDCAEQTVMDIGVNLSSCVPATGFETSGAQLEVDDLLPFRDHAHLPPPLPVEQARRAETQRGGDPRCAASVSLSRRSAAQRSKKRPEASPAARLRSSPHHREALARPAWRPLC